MDSIWLEPVVTLLAFHFAFWFIACVLTQSRLQWRYQRRISRGEVVGLCIAALCGYVYFFILNSWFAYTPEHNPIFIWLLKNTTQTPWFRPLVMLQDLVQQTALAIPMAWILLKIRPAQHATVLLLFMLPSFAYSYSNLLLDPSWLEHWRLYVAGMIFNLTVFPIVYVCLFKWMHYRTASLRIE